ncbi:hypothetical protein BC938DRAFT_479302 [Jimgerdemannia flammicorona]|uniref:Uncharacterized protein n=1 Tax=Jimgerdemannia flammicorona TaxID=994334 RepID=A0A433QL54_9FUNG|nr:hypothetical protein BC938DRAFT_479302 [Jimgerdemannia flammicorona]
MMRNFHPRFCRQRPCIVEPIGPLPRRDAPAFRPTFVPASLAPCPRTMVTCTVQCARDSLRDTARPGSGCRDVLREGRGGRARTRAGAEMRGTHAEVLERDREDDGKSCEEVGVEWQWWWACSGEIEDGHSANRMDSYAKATKSRRLH